MIVYELKLFIFLSPLIAIIRHRHSKATKRSVLSVVTIVIASKEAIHAVVCPLCYSLVTEECRNPGNTNHRHCKYEVIRERRHNRLSRLRVAIIS